MRTFGEAGTVRTGTYGKVGNHGVIMTMMRYIDNHEGNCYHMYNPLRNSIVESRDMMWLCHRYYEQLDADITELDPLVVVIGAKYPRDEVMVEFVEQRVKVEEVKEDNKDNGSARSEVSRALSSLEQEVRRSVRSPRQTTNCNPTTGETTELSAVQNDVACLAELDNEELTNTIEVEIFIWKLKVLGPVLVMVSPILMSLRL